MEAFHETKKDLWLLHRFGTSYGSQPLSTYNTAASDETRPAEDVGGGVLVEVPVVPNRDWHTRDLSASRRD
jgi:hypothetical protein